MIRGTVSINKENCKACELCIIACPQDCLILSQNINLRGYRYIELIDGKCTGCINCALVCPDIVFTVYRQPKAKAKQTV